LVVDPTIDKFPCRTNLLNDVALTRYLAFRARRFIQDVFPSIHGGGGKDPEPGIINPDCFLWFETDANKSALLA
jgi:hypothetical protein